MYIISTTVLLDIYVFKHHRTVDREFFACKIFGRLNFCLVLFSFYFCRYDLSTLKTQSIYLWRKIFRQFNFHCWRWWTKIFYAKIFSQFTVFIYLHMHVKWDITYTMARTKPAITISIVRYAGTKSETADDRSHASLPSLLLVWFMVWQKTPAASTCLKISFFSLSEANSWWEQESSCSSSPVQWTLFMWTGFLGLP